MKKLSLLALAVLGFATNALACNSYSELEVSVTEADPDVHSMVTHDVWAIWFHPDAFTKEQAQFVAERLAMVRCEGVNYLEMIDPLAAREGYYSNVFLHRTDDDIVDDGFPDDWGSAVGKNDDNHSEMELADEDAWDLYTIDHEGFHVLQDSVTNRYENVEAYSFWIAEASVDWFAWLQDPNLPSAFDQAASIFVSPQLPFWAEEQSLTFHMESSDLVGTRPYAFHALLGYIQLHTAITKSDITDGYFQGDQTPQERLVKRLGFDGFADTYADFNAKLTAMMIEGEWGETLDTFVFTPQQRAVAVSGIEDYLDPDGDSDFGDMVQPIAAYVDAEDLEEDWTWPEGEARPFGWGYNVVEIDYPMGEPTLEFEGRDMRLRLVTLQDEEWYIETVESGDALDLEPVDSAYLVITSTPKRLSGYERYNYRLRLQ